MLVVTHIDNDHIAGVLSMLDAGALPRPDDVWFNGYRHLPRSPMVSMGPAEAERLSTFLEANRYPWNAQFAEKAVMRDQPRVHDRLRTTPIRALPGGLRYTVLSPGTSELERLRDRTTWSEIVRQAEPTEESVVESQVRTRLRPMGGIDVDGLADEPTATDSSVANGSSIALLFEYGGASCLLGADAHADVLLTSLDQIVGEGNPLGVDVFKLPHHGSKANVTSELVKRVPARCYVFSTDGSGHQCHPDDQAVARAVKYGPPSSELAFNYRSAQNVKWDNAALQRLYGYSTRYPVANESGVVIDVMATHLNVLRANQ